MKKSIQKNTGQTPLLFIITLAVSKIYIFRLHAEESFYQSEVTDLSVINCLFNWLLNMY